MAHMLGDHCDWKDRHKQWPDYVVPCWPEKEVLNLFKVQ